MRIIIMLALFARGARALSAVPAAARRLQKIKELESKHALLVESGAKPAVIRNARKELGRVVLLRLRTGAVGMPGCISLKHTTSGAPRRHLARPARGFERPSLGAELVPQTSLPQHQLSMLF